MTVRSEGCERTRETTRGRAVSSIWLVVMHWSTVAKTAGEMSSAPLEVMRVRDDIQRVSVEERDEGDHDVVAEQQAVLLVQRERQKRGERRGGLCEGDELAENKRFGEGGGDERGECRRDGLDDDAQPADVDGDQEKRVDELEKRQMGLRRARLDDVYS